MWSGKVDWVNIEAGGARQASQSRYIVVCPFVCLGMGDAIGGWFGPLNLKIKYIVLISSCTKCLGEFKLLSLMCF